MSSGLFQAYYDAVVISDEIDPNHAGAVRVRVIGVTDEFNDSDQPFVLPCANSFMAVPTKGSWLRVEFSDGDINMGRYTHVSADLNFYPEEYLQNYPNVAYKNLGSDIFKMIHYRDAKETMIRHDSSSSIRWDSLGVITHDSDLAYPNAGYGAKGGSGQKVQAVLTGGTIDVFCCTPVSSQNGSEYFWVSHVSRETVEGSKPADNVSEDVSMLEAPKTKPLNGTEVEFIETASKTPAAAREVIWVVVTFSGGDDYIKVHEDVMDNAKHISYHYIIGKDAASAQSNSLISGVVGSSRNADTDTSPNGFAQYIDTKDMAYYGGNDDIGGIQVNLSAISVCLIGTGGSELDIMNGPTDYQYQRIADILKQAKADFGEQVFVASTEDFTKPKSVGLFDVTRVT